jgi:hypothetical protein
VTLGKNRQLFNRTEKTIIYGGLGIIGLSLFLKARALGNMVFSPGNITSMSFQNGLPVASFTVLAQNTSSSSLTLSSFAGNVFANDILIGNVYNFSPVFIAGNSQTPINVDVQLKALGIVNDLIRAFQYNNFAQDLTVSGFANVSGLQLPVNLDFKVGNQGL